MAIQRIYLIGAGSIARSHADAIRLFPHAEQVQLFVADPNTQTRDAFIEHYPQAHAFDHADQMLAEPAYDTDIVVVATPPSTHHDLTCAALASGRHVLCEKPLAMDRAQAQEMLTTARKHQRLLGCCSVRFLDWPPAEEARRLLQTNTLGTLYHIRFLNLEQRNRPGIEYQPETRWFLDQSKSGGGTLMDRAPYEFSVLNDLLQPVRVDVLSAWLAEPVTALDLPEDIINDVEQHAGATLRYHFADGKTLIMSYERASCTHSAERSAIEIEGLEGTLKWDWPSRYATNTLTHSYDHAGQLESKISSFASPFRNKIRFGDKPLFYFYQRMLGEASRAVVNEQALFNFSCINAIYACAHTGEPQSVFLQS